MHLRGKKEIEERDNTRLSNSPRSTLSIFLSFFFFFLACYPQFFIGSFPDGPWWDEMIRGEASWLDDGLPSLAHLHLDLSTPFAFLFLFVFFFLIPTATAFPDSLYCFFCVSSFIFFSSAPVRWGAFQRGAGKDGGEETSVRGLAVDWPIITCYNISQSPALFLIVFLSSGFPRLGLTLFWSCSPEKQQPSVSQVALLVFLIQSPASPYFCSCRLSCTPLLTTSSSSDLHRPEKGKWGVLLPPCLSSAVPL